MTTRPDWESYFFGIAKAVAQRATCPRAKIGAIIVRDNHIIGTGYNGAPPGEPHCTDVGCLLVDGHCKRAIHAEENALRHALMDVRGADLYIWESVEKDICADCDALARKVGIHHITIRAPNSITYRS